MSDSVDGVNTPEARSRPATPGFWTFLKIRTVVWVAGGLISAVLLTLKFVILPWFASTTVQGMADAYGVNLEVDSWTGDLTEFSVTAHDVTVLISGVNFDRQDLLRIDQVELDLSIWSRVVRDQWVRTVRVVDPHLYLERTSSGTWNWHRIGRFLASADSGGSGEDSPPGSEFTLGEVLVEGMSMEWVEHLRGDAADGQVERRAKWHMDDIAVSLDDVRGLLDPRPRASLISLEARTGEGRISFSGEGNFFQWSGEVGAGESPPGQDAPAAHRKPQWRPSLGAKLYLENIAATTLARLTPHATLLPAGGSFTGLVDLDLAERELRCDGQLEMRSVVYKFNPSSTEMVRQRRQLETALAAFEANGPQTFDCGGDLRSETFRPMQGFQTAVTRSAVRDADPIVQVAANVDNHLYTGGELEPDTQDWLDQYARWIPPAVRERVEQRTGQPVGETIRGWGRRLRNR